MKLRRIMSFVTAFLMLALLFPTAFAAGSRTAPEGYDEYEYNKVVSFLNITDDSGATNASKLGITDLDDPSTWSNSILWSGGHVVMFSAVNKDLKGDLDVSGFTELDMLYCARNDLSSVNASDCPSMTMMDCNGNSNMTALSVAGSSLIQEFDASGCALVTLDMSGLSGIDIGVDLSDNELVYLNMTGCANVPYLFCDSNKLETLILDGCTSLNQLNCGSNNLTELDLSGCTALSEVNCLDNPLTSVILAGTEMRFDSFVVEGSGTISIWDMEHDEDNRMLLLQAEAAEGAEFLGWYDGDTLLSTDVFADLTETMADIGTVITAKFSVAPLLGDVNCDGTVGFDDVTMLASYIVHALSELSEQSMINADMNQDGEVNSLDISYIYNYLMNKR